MKFTSLAIAVVFSLAGADSPSAGHGHVPSPQVQPNDNRVAGGRLQGDTLRIDLVVQMGTWLPEADTGPAIQVAAFAEEGRAPQIPGPLIRVRQGTVVVARVRNALSDSAITIHGLVTHPAATGDSLVLRPGEASEVRFPAGEPGTYLYWAALGSHSIDPPGPRNLEEDDEREQVAGAFIVDPAAGSPPDRILMINIWGETVDSANYRNALTINGRSWPHNERLEALIGDTVRWRVINSSGRNHPMHLHGFYFTVDARGDGRRDSLYSVNDRRLVVTEGLQPFETMAMSFVPDRPGNWLFHCHLAFHVVPDTRLNPPPRESHDRMAHDPGTHMAGLVLGFTVRPRGESREVARGRARRLQLFVNEGTRRGQAPRSMGFVLQRGASPPARDSVEIPGTVLVLTRGEPTDIVVTNRLKETAAIHWHGIELESFSDGVAGWSGAGDQLAPSILPGDSFIAELTLPRAGTFIYHTHMNDVEQLTSGLYGAIVVVDPAQPFDPATDHVFVVGWDGEEEPPHILVNGDSAPPPLELAAGVIHRLRFVNIGPAVGAPFSLFRDSSLVSWRRRAKDGADLPPHQAKVGPARQIVRVGETNDVEVNLAPGEYRLTFGPPAEPFWVQKVIVR